MSDPDPSAIYELTSAPSHLLHRAQQFAADRFSEAMDGEQITQRQFAVLTAVAANEGLTQTDLVKATGIDRSTLAELVARMSRRNLLLRERARLDARANTVRLTDEGRTLLDYAAPRVRAADEAILSALAKNKRAAFLDTLKRIAETLDAPEPAPAPSGPKADAAADAKAQKKRGKKAKDSKPEKAEKVAKADKPGKGKKAKKASKSK